MRILTEDMTEREKIDFYFGEHVTIEGNKLVIDMSEHLRLMGADNLDAVSAVTGLGTLTAVKNDVNEWKRRSDSFQRYFESYRQNYEMKHGSTYYDRGHSVKSWIF